MYYIIFERDFCAYSLRDLGRQGYIGSDWDSKMLKNSIDYAIF